MSNEFKLEIFEPLDNYFRFLYEINGNSYNNVEGSKYLSDIKNFITDDCDANANLKTGNNVSNNFKLALKNFAYQLREYDSPISHITLKGPFKILVEKAIREMDNSNTMNENDIEKLIKIIINHIDNTNDVNGKFDLDKRVTDNEVETYKDSLIAHLEKFLKDKDKLKSEVVDYITDNWLQKVFIMYKNSIQKFKSLLNYIISEANAKRKIAKYQFDLLNKYFSVKTDGNNYSISKVFGNGDNDWGMIKQSVSSGNNMSNPINIRGGRLNVNVNKDKKMAEICELFPEELKNTFNDYLLSARLKTDKIYIAKDKCWIPETKNVANVMDYMKSTLLSASKKPENQMYEKDTEDTEEYTDEDDNKHPLSYYKEKINDPANNDKWRMDTEGNIYKKDDKGRYVKYNTEEKAKEDMEDFKNGKNCGNLCIYKDPAKCQEFFELLLKNKGKTFEPNVIEAFVKDKNFITNFEALKENIVNVNPVYVLGTLRAFGFEKWSSLGPNGKEVKVESFTRWWKRTGKDLTGVDADYKRKKAADAVKGLESTIEQLRVKLRNDNLNDNEREEIEKIIEEMKKLDEKAKELKDEKDDDAVEANYNYLYYGVAAAAVAAATYYGISSLYNYFNPADMKDAVLAIAPPIEKLAIASPSVVVPMNTTLSNISTPIIQQVTKSIPTLTQIIGSVPTTYPTPSPFGGADPNTPHKLFNADGTEYEPSPPQKLELFLKLLVDFINNNKFVLNPVTKQLVNSPQIKTSIYPKEINEALYNMETIDVIDKNGKPLKIKNGSYISPEKRRRESSESLASALETSRKINQFKPHHITLRDMGYLGVMGSVFDVLLETIYDLNPNQNIMNVPGLSFTGYSGPITGGSKTLKSKKMIGGEPDINNVLDEINKGNSAEAIKMINQIPGSCTSNALLTYNNINGTLKKHGKQLGDDLNNEIAKNLSKLYESEKTLSRDLNILAKFAIILNAIPEEIAEDKILRHRAQEIIDDYNKRSSGVSKYSNNLYDLMGRLEKSSSYSSL